MTRTVDRKPITQAMQLALWKRWGRVDCARCGAPCIAQTGSGSLFRTDSPFHWDHHLALVDGGKHEFENLRPICPHCHREKSKREHKENARAKRRAKRHTNPLPPGKIKSRGFDKTRSRKMDGSVVPRNPASADNTGV